MESPFRLTEDGHFTFEQPMADLATALNRYCDLQKQEMYVVVDGYYPCTLPMSYAEALQVSIALRSLRVPDREFMISKADRPYECVLQPGRF